MTTMKKFGVPETMDRTVPDGKDMDLLVEEIEHDEDASKLTADDMFWLEMDMRAKAAQVAKTRTTDKNTLVLRRINALRRSWKR